MHFSVLTDRHATANSWGPVQSFWHSFSDRESGIQTYEYCISSEDLPGECNIKPLSKIGIATNIEMYPDSQLEHGKYI